MVPVVGLLLPNDDDDDNGMMVVIIIGALWSWWRLLVTVAVTASDSGEGGIAGASQYMISEGWR